MSETAKMSFFPKSTPLETAVLVFDQCNTLSFAAAVDPMRAANRRSGSTLFDWTFYTASGDPAQLTSGPLIQGPPIASLARCDLLLLVAGFGLEDHATPRLLSSLRRLCKSGAVIAAIDGAPWLLAQAGLLDGHVATTHWEDLDAFATRFPQIDTRKDRFVSSPPFATSGGAAPGLDMMLFLIAERFGRPLADRVASAFLYDPLAAGPQRPSAPADPIRRNPQIARALNIMSQTIDVPLSIGEIARQVSLSVRSLEQRFSNHLDMSPHAYYLRVRLNEALRLATDTDMPVQEIALATGFSSQTSFSRAFRRIHGNSVRSVRSAAPPERNFGAP